MIHKTDNPLGRPYSTTSWRDVLNLKLEANRMITDKISLQCIGGRFRGGFVVDP